jgi:disulfide bond formation protein DsbB
MNKFIRKYILYIAWVQAFVATVGSWYFSEVRHFVPCILCWYQRIFMYPLVFIIAVGILKKDHKVSNYILPLSIAGAVVAFYQNLLYYNVLPESSAPCTLGVSCTTRYIEYFGFLTIPLLSLLAFVTITFCALVYRRIIR